MHRGTFLLLPSQHTQPDGHHPSTTAHFGIFKSHTTTKDNSSCALLPVNLYLIPHSFLQCFLCTLFLLVYRYLLTKPYEAQ